jgi:hypothetical protein
MKSERVNGKGKRWEGVMEIKTRKGERSQAVVLMKDFSVKNEEERMDKQ